MAKHLIVKTIRCLCLGSVPKAKLRKYINYWLGFSKLKSTFILYHIILYFLHLTSKQMSLFVDQYLNSYPDKKIFIHF